MVIETRRRGKNNQTESLQGLDDGGSLQDLVDDEKSWLYESTGNVANDEAAIAIDDDDSPPKTRSGRSKNKVQTTMTTTTTARNTRSAINAATARASTKRGGGKKQSSSSQPLLKNEPHIQKALTESHYEAFTDPYRGISPWFWLENGHNHNTSNNGGNAKKNNNGGDMSHSPVGRVGRNGDAVEEYPCPWIGCAPVLDSGSCANDWKFTLVNCNGNGNDNDENVGQKNVEVVNIDSDTEGNETTRSNHEEERSAKVMFVQCGCPTVDSWARAELEEYEKQKAAEEKKRKAAEKKKKSKSKNSKGGSRKRKKFEEEEEEVQVVGEEDEDVMVVEEDGEKEEEQVSLEGNTISTRVSEDKGALFICGERDTDSFVRHPCDYNPLCLASLGGMVDIYRQSAAKVFSNDTAKGLSESKTSKLLHVKMTEEINTPNNGKNGNKGGDGDLRRSTLVDQNAIQTHLSRYICPDNSADDIFGDASERKANIYLTQLEFIHESLISQPKPSESGKIELSMPPGLRNLGATCYLNSQLQCLAQNLAFVHGLFSWTKPTINTGSEYDRRMATVLSNMQSILGRMRYGPDRVLCTNEFASSLDLNNDEMQDPNEFARLLFDRMQDSFRRSAELTLESTADQNNSNLGQLLPSIFGGTTKYVTRCSECQSRSNRSENFMELSVPIVDCSEEEEEEELSQSGAGGKKKIGKGKQAKVKNAASSDVDVQRCLNSYLHPESLDGDNRYECSNCNRKCDATRSMIFSKLPPVLNIQLARYVFDRETLSKRKLQTKVLLPKSLELPPSATESHKPAKYILCAVQNHLGTSAHGGHYIADVMDWSTGVWHEFNDSEVTILENGPTSSFKTSDDSMEEENSVEESKVSGSADAYNLFYVDQEYLATHYKTELECMGTETKAEQSNNVLTCIKVERQERYHRELEIQTRNTQKNARISFRQQQIIEKLFSSKIFSAVDNSDKIWVDANFLRRFFSCQDGLEDIFLNAPNSSSFLKRHTFICEDSTGLHPRQARQGKLLLSDVYNVLEDIMRNEYSKFLSDQGNETAVAKDTSLFDHKIIQGHRLICNDCGSAYQEDMRAKHDVFKALVAVHDATIPGENDLDQNYPYDDPSSVYAVTRTFTTQFRKYIEKKAAELKNPPPKKSPGKDKATNNSLYGGIDMLDLTDVMENDGQVSGQSVEQKGGQVIGDSKESSDPFNGEDPTSKISCPHDCCHMMHNRRSTRLISAEVWHTLKKVFPDANPHQFELPRDDASSIGNCKQCYFEKEEEDIFPKKMKDWKCKLKEQGQLSELLERGSKLPSQIDVCLQTQSPLKLRAVHHNDVQRWRDCVSVIEKSLKSKKKVDAIKKQLNDILFVPSQSSPCGRMWRVRPLTCEEHRLAVGLAPLPDRENMQSWLDKLTDSSIELLIQEEHEALVVSLSTLEAILHSEPDELLNDCIPPTISLSFNKDVPSLSIEPQLCTHGCSIDLSVGESTQNDTAADTNEKQSNGSKTAKEIEIIDSSPKGPLCKIVVHEVERDNDIGVAATTILLDIEKDSITTSVTGRPRRSRKARGSAAGGFPTEEVEMALDGNLAHFRLLLHQTKGKNLYGQRLFLLNENSHEDSKEDCKEDAEELIPETSNRKTLYELVSSFSPSDEATDDGQKDCTVHVILSYQQDSTNSNGTKRGPRKRLSQEEKEEEENLLLSLAEYACGGWKTMDAVVNGKKPNRHRQERGFVGTFLQSSSELDAPANPSSPGKNATIAAKQDNSTTVVIMDTPMKLENDVASPKNPDNNANNNTQTVDEGKLQMISFCTDAIEEQVVAGLKENPHMSPASLLRTAIDQRIKNYTQKMPQQDGEITEIVSSVL